MSHVYSKKISRCSRSFGVPFVPVGISRSGTDSPLPNVAHKACVSPNRRRFLWSVEGVWREEPSLRYGLRGPELIQTGVQTYQAYRLSALVARQWMNWIIVLLLVLNCWATLIIQSKYHSSLGSARLMCLLVNLMLDLVSYVIFPTALFLPYYANFDSQRGNFDMHFWYTDVWLIQVINEWQMLVVTSFWDAAGKFFIAFNITRSLRSIPRLISCTRSTSTIGTGILVPKVSHVSFATIAPSDAAKISLPQSTSSATDFPLSGTKMWSRRIEHLGHRTLALWGLTVFVCHIQSAVTGNNDQWLVQVRPWFTTRPVCSLMEISCLGGRLSGNAADFDRSIESIQRDWLAYLIIRHCDEVEITPRIHDLPFLLALKLYNSTLVRWDVDAALTQTYSPNMLFLFLAKVNAQAIPPGIYDRDFPLKLADVELSDWNVTELPLEIADVWPAGMFLVIEKFRFPVFPEVLKVVRPGYLSMSFNNFTEIPLEFWANDQLIFLNLNGNPIRELPASKPTPQPMIFLAMVATNISQLPSWIQPAYMVELDAGSTPYCQSLLSGDAAALNVTPALIEDLRAHINCTPASKYRYLTHYPLENEPLNNPSKVH